MTVLKIIWMSLNKFTEKGTYYNKKQKPICNSQKWTKVTTLDWNWI